mgnify:CR=1 FL=1
MRFYLYQMDYTDLTDETCRVEYRITNRPMTAEALQRSHLAGELGSFGTLEGARRAVQENAGILGISRLETERDDDSVIEVYGWGEAGVLTPHGTRTEYGEWAFDIARDDPATFERKARQACLDAIDRQISYPDHPTLLLLLNEYRTEILAGDYDED